MCVCVCLWNASEKLGSLPSELRGGTMEGKTLVNTQKVPGFRLGYHPEARSGADGYSSGGALVLGKS